MSDRILFCEEHRIDAHDVDYEGRLRPSVLLRYLQDAAGHAHHLTGPSLEELREKGMAYILSRVSMKLYDLPAVYDHVCAQTWIGPLKGYSFHRYGRILQGDRVIGEMSSVWALTDISDPAARRLLRSDAVQLHFGVGQPLDLGFAPRFRLPPDAELAEVGEYTVRYADCDQNRHMNNTVYPDMFRGFASEAEGKRVSEFEVSYLAEAPMGDRLTILRAVQGNEQLFRSIRSDGRVGAEARMVFLDE